MAAHGQGYDVAMPSSTHMVERTWHDTHLEYLVRELSVVTDEELTTLINDTVAEGWHFDSIQFAMWEGSRRPSMAFVMFVRPRTAP